MAGDVVLTRDGPVSVPMDYVVPSAGELLPLSVRATIDGSSAGSSFYAVVQVIAPSGRNMGSYISSSIAAGASADVTWFPKLAPQGSSAAPSPNPLGTLWAWYDFSDTSTLTIDGSSNIQSIKDKTGNGHDLGQGTAAARPAQTTVNGLNAALCNSAAYTYLIGGPFTPSLPQPYTVCIVHTQSVAVGTANYLPGAFGNVTANSTGVLFQVNTASNYFLTVSNTNIIGSGVLTPFTQRLFTAIVDGGSSHLRVSGTGDTAGTLRSGFPLDTVALGAAHVPERLPLVEGLDGAVCESLVYSGHLSTAQLSAVESYLKTKWNTP